VECASNYPWSSAAAHCSGSEDPWLDVEPPSFSIPNWREWLDAGRDQRADDFIRECSATGRPCGDDAFVKQIEITANRDFTRKKPGPKPRVKEDAPQVLWTDDRIVS
jgi:putative transposase